MNPNLYNQGLPELKDTIPIHYSSKMLLKTYEASVIPAIANTDYQGEFKKCGDEIKIPKMPDIKVRGWKQGDKIHYPRVSAESVTMKIEHGLVWSFQVEKLQQAQSIVKDFGSKWIADAVKQAERYTERTCIQKILTDDKAEFNFGNNAGKDFQGYKLGLTTQPVNITAGVTSGDSTGTGAQNAIDYITDISAVLDEAGYVAGDTVRILVPKVFKNRLQKSSEFKLADAKGDSNTSVRFGKKAVGKVADCEIIETSYVEPIVVSGKRVFPIIACTKRAVSYALQFTDSWAGDLVHEVATGYRGVGVFGLKVIEPRSLAIGWVTMAAN